MTFRLSGTAHDGQKWNTPKSIRSIATELDSIVGRPTAADGTVASRIHDAVSPNSDHKPKPKTAEFGWVRAIDFTVTRKLGDTISNQLRLRRDPRIKYLIWNRRMFSSYTSGGVAPFVWRPYNGANGHLTHIHLSMIPAGDADASTWGIAPTATETENEEKIMAVSNWAETSFQKAIDANVFNDGHRLKAQNSVTLEQLAVFLDRADVFDDPVWVFDLSDLRIVEK